MESDRIGQFQQDKPTPHTLKVEPPIITENANVFLRFRIYFNQFFVNTLHFFKQFFHVNFSPGGTRDFRAQNIFKNIQIDLVMLSSFLVYINCEKTLIKVNTFNANCVLCIELLQQISFNLVPSSWFILNEKGLEFVAKMEDKKKFVKMK